MAFAVVLGCGEDASRGNEDAPTHTNDGHVEPDAAPDTGTDAAADAPVDAPLDATADFPVDAVGDSGSDGTSDATPDVGVDVFPDATADAGADVSPDTPTDANPDVAADAVTDAGADAGTPPRCAAVGGFCTEVRWEVCPAGYEPAAGDGNQDCPGGAWCCVPAPPSECSDSSSGNCLEGSTCPSCWGPTSGSPACEPGRICCDYICD